MKRINFGTINNFILFGGGRVLCSLILTLKQQDYSVVVFSSRRHLDELIGRQLSLEQFLQKNNIKYFLSDNINLDKNIDNYITNSTLGLSFGAAWIFKKKLIDKFNGRLLNSHGTRLPRFRAGAGYSWRILQDNRQGASLLHQVDTGVDTGDIVKQKKYTFPRFCKTSEDYYNFAFEKDISFLTKFIKATKKQKSFKIIIQNESKSTYFPRLNTPKHGFINWSWTAKEINLFIRAFDDPYTGASTFINGKRIFLKKSDFNYKHGLFHPFQAGLIYRKTDDTIFVAVKNGTIIIKRALDDKGIDILKSLKIGDRFYTPTSYLEQAMMYRAAYDTNGLKNKDYG